MDFGNIRRKSKLGTRRSSILKSGFRIPPVADVPEKEDQFKNPNDVFLTMGRKSSMWDPAVETPHLLCSAQEPAAKNLRSIWCSTSENVVNSRNNLTGKNKLSDMFDKNLKVNDRPLTSELLCQNEESDFVAQELFLGNDEVNQENDVKLCSQSTSNYDACKYLTKSSKCLFKSLIECSPNDSLSSGIKPLSPIVVNNCILIQASKESDQLMKTQTELLNENDNIHQISAPATTTKLDLLNKYNTPKIKIEKGASDPDEFLQRQKAIEQSVQNNLHSKLLNKTSALVLSTLEKDSNLEDKRKMDSKIKRMKCMESIMLLSNDCEDEFNLITDIMSEQKKSINKMKSIIYTLQKM